MERFVRIANGFKSLNIFKKRAILDVWQGFVQLRSKYS